MNGCPKSLYISCLYTYRISIRIFYESQVELLEGERKIAGKFVHSWAATHVFQHTRCTYTRWPAYYCSVLYLVSTFGMVLLSPHFISRPRTLHIYIHRKEHVYQSEAGELSWSSRYVILRGAGICYLDCRSVLMWQYSRNEVLKGTQVRSSLTYIAECELSECQTELIVDMWHPNKFRNLLSWFQTRAIMWQYSQNEVLKGTQPRRGLR
jgi:hypothetical protein